MLTNEGYRNRFWREYPRLRQLLERPDSSAPHGVDLLRLVDQDEFRVSTDHGPHGRLADVIAIARLLASRCGEVQDAMRSDASSARGTAREVRQLLSELEERVQAFQYEIAQACSREIEVARTIALDLSELGERPAWCKPMSLTCTAS